MALEPESAAFSAVSDEYGSWMAVERIGFWDPLYELFGTKVASPLEESKAE